MGATFSATPFQTGDTPIRDLNPPNDLTRAERDRQMEALARMNHEFREEYALNSDISARLKAYELAARVQISATPLVDFGNESQSTLDLYGIGVKETNDFGRQLLLARRMVEKGVRFIQICHAGRGNGSWGRARRYGDPRAALPRHRQAHRWPHQRPQIARHARQHSDRLDH